MSRLIGNQRSGISCLGCHKRLAAAVGEAEHKLKSSVAQLGPFLSYLLAKEERQRPRPHVPRIRRQLGIHGSDVNILHTSNFEDVKVGVSCDLGLFVHYCLGTGCSLVPSPVSVVRLSGLLRHESMSKQLAS